MNINTAQELAHRYVAVWNEPDADTRRTAVEALWTDDGVHLLEPPEEIVKRATEIGVSATLQARGHAELVQRVNTAYGEFVAPGQYEFVPHGEVAVLDDMVKLRWAMVPAGGGEPLAIGIDLLLVAPDGRIRTDYQFIEA
ncbi:hypothetical protein GCM10009630_14940 [Kribbella jejuensis]|uniref:SnoaL-like protein n=1 Tax=Kribbella jejuensis TaxID=236068 RepID=A0A542DAM5_9ACTN|nr:hypothetical protein [Kribbella jejuensis]TQJ00085.1 hypothetical protein FB475_7077 [Kribbella jejuensis]